MPEISGYLPAGSYSTEDTLGIMAEYARKDHADPEIQNLAFNITSKIYNNDLRSKMLAIRNWILSNLIFVTDPTEATRLFGDMSEHMEHGELEMIKSPLVVLGTGRYDCDCISSLIAAILMVLGIPCRFVAVAFHDESITGPDGYSHVFCQGFDGVDWFTIDPVSFPNEKRMLEKDIRQFKVFQVS